MSKKSDAKVARTRNLIIGLVAAAIVLIIGYGMLYSTGVTQGEFVAGEHYEVLENPTRRRPGQPLEVREFFSYGCIHCKNFDPVLEKWQTGIPDDVSFARSPVTFSPIWALLAQTYFTLEALDILETNHPRLFRAIHDRRTQFLSAEEIADFIDGNGTTRDEFLTTFNGPEVRRAMRKAEAAQRTAGINSVPTLVVADKYIVTMDHGTRVALEIVDHLLAQERSSAATGSQESAAAES